MAEGHFCCAAGDWQARTEAAAQATADLQQCLEASTREAVRLRAFREAATRREAEIRECAAQRLQLQQQLEEAAARSTQVTIGEESVGGGGDGGHIHPHVYIPPSVWTNTTTTPTTAAGQPVSMYNNHPGTGGTGQCRGHNSTTSGSVAVAVGGGSSLPAWQVGGGHASGGS